MKLLLDSQIFDSQKFGGISRYYTELVKRVSEPIYPLCAVKYTQNFHLTECFPGLAKEPVFNKLNSYFKYGFSRRKRNKRFVDTNYASSIALLKKQDFDVFIPTYYDPYFLEFLGEKPFVITVYDMIHELMADYIDYDGELIANKKTLIEKADKVIAISQSTKNDIVALYPHVNPDKIEIVYLSESIDSTTNVSLDLPENYILFVGNRGQYKNFNFFLEALAPLLKSRDDLYVVNAGGGNLRNSEKRFIKSLSLEDKVLQFNFKDFELFEYYNKALCFVFPSMYEGFGIPVLEAMKANCPVVLANHSSFPEVAQDAALYFELDNQNDLKEKVSQLVDNPEIRQAFIEKGKHQAAKFSWDKMALESMDIYKSVI